MFLQFIFEAQLFPSRGSLPLQLSVAAASGEGLAEENMQCAIRWKVRLEGGVGHQREKDGGALVPGALFGT